MKRKYKFLKIISSLLAVLTILSFSLVSAFAAPEDETTTTTTSTQTTTQSTQTTTSSSEGTGGAWMEGIDTEISNHEIGEEFDDSERSYDEKEGSPTYKEDTGMNFYIEAEPYSLISISRILGKLIVSLLVKIVDFAEEGIFNSAYKALNVLGFTNIREYLFGGYFRNVIIAFLTVGLVILGFYILFRQREFMGKRREIFLHVISFILILVALPTMMLSMNNLVMQSVDASNATAYGVTESRSDTIIRANVIDWVYVADRAAIGDGHENEKGEIYGDYLKNDTTLGYQFMPSVALAQGFDSLQMNAALDTDDFTTYNPNLDYKTKSALQTKYKEYLRAQRKADKDGATKKQKEKAAKLKQDYDNLVATYKEELQADLPVRFNETDIYPTDDIAEMLTSPADTKGFIEGYQEAREDGEGVARSVVESGKSYVKNFFTKMIGSAAEVTVGGAGLGIINLIMGSKMPYYRYSVDWLPLIAMLILLALVYIMLAYKVLRLILELFISGVLAPFVAATDFISAGRRTTEVIKYIASIYAMLMFIPILLNIYELGMTFIGQQFPYSEDKIMYIFVTFVWSTAIMDGPNIVQRLFGLDMNLSSGWQRMRGAANKVLGSAKKVAGTAASVAVGGAMAVEAGAGIKGALKAGGKAGLKNAVGVTPGNPIEGMTLMQEEEEDVGVKNDKGVSLGMRDNVKKLSAEDVEKVFSDKQESEEIDTKDKKAASKQEQEETNKLAKEIGRNSAQELNEASDKAEGKLKSNNRRRMLSALAFGLPGQWAANKLMDKNNVNAADAQGVEPPTTSVPEGTAYHPGLQQAEVNAQQVIASTNAKLKAQGKQPLTKAQEDQIRQGLVDAHTNGFTNSKGEHIGGYNSIFGNAEGANKNAEVISSGTSLSAVSSALENHTVAQIQGQRAQASFLESEAFANIVSGQGMQAVHPEKVAASNIRAGFDADGTTVINAPVSTYTESGGGTVRRTVGSSGPVIEERADSAVSQPMSIPQTSTQAGSLFVAAQMGAGAMDYANSMNYHLNPNSATVKLAKGRAMGNAIGQQIVENRNAPASQRRGAVKRYVKTINDMASYASTLDNTMSPSRLQNRQSQNGNNLSPEELRRLMAELEQHNRDFAANQAAHEKFNGN